MRISDASLSLFRNRSFKTNTSRTTNQSRSKHKSDYKFRPISKLKTQKTPKPNKKIKKTSRNSTKYTPTKLSNNKTQQNSQTRRFSNSRQTKKGRKEFKKELTRPVGEEPVREHKDTNRIGDELKLRREKSALNK